MIKVPPLVPLRRYETLSRLAGKRAEQLRLWLSTIWGRPHMRRSSEESQYWKQFEEYRTAASICDPAAISLWRTLAKTRPKVIVEFGTGFSTFVIASFGQQMLVASQQKPAIISVEDDSRWFTKQQGLLREASLSNNVYLVHGAIEARTYFGSEVMCYGAVETTLTALYLEGLTDFVFVDGPPAKMFGTVGRRGSILQALSISKMGGTILIHDALRDEEYNIIREFHANKGLPFICHGIIPLWYGLAICEKNLKTQ